MIDDLVKRLRNGLCMLAQEEAADRIEELEAKLAKAVEALRYALDGAAYSYNGMNFEGEYSDELATLNELTGESHD